MLATLAGVAFGQLQTGNLYGAVEDDEGQPLPGVTVTLAGDQAPQIQVSNAEGRFRFLGLPPGRYRVSAELQGFSIVEYSNIAIGVGRNTTIEITLSSAIEETITVTSEAPLLDQRRAHRGTNVTVEELDQIPTARDPWSLLSQAPGVLVDRINVGGNESGQQSNFLGTGALGTENTFAVDGVNLTDMAAVGGSTTYYDFGAFEEVQFTVGSSDVSVVSAGVTVNQVTKRGGNRWQASARYLRTDGDLQSSPSLIDVGGDLVPGNEIDAVEEFGADVGGPILKDRLWIWAGYGESDIGNLVAGGGGVQQLDRTQLEDFNTKLSFQASKSNSGEVHYWTNDKIKTGRGAGPDRAPETTHNQITPADIWKLEDTHLFSSNFFVTGLWSNNDGVFNAAPEGGRDADIFRGDDGILRGSYWDFAQRGMVDQGRLDASYFFNTGDTGHELKFGGGFRTQENTSGTVWPRGKYVFSCEYFGCASADNNNELVQLWRNKSLAIESSYDSAWVQDTITRDRWTVNVGLRYDRQTVENLASTSPAHQDNQLLRDAGIVNPDGDDLLPQLDFQGNDAGGFEWESIVPRIGVTYALGEHRRTLLRGTFSQYVEQLGQITGSRVNPTGGYAYAMFYFTDSNANLVLDSDEFGSLSYYYYYNFNSLDPSALATPNVTDPDLDPTLTSEVTFGAEHAFTPHFSAGVTLTYRDITDIPEVRQLVTDLATGDVRVATRDDYVLGGTVCNPDPDPGPGQDPACFLPDGSQVSDVPVYELGPGVSNTGGQFYTNGSREQDYLGVTVNLSKRLANRWSLRGHFTWSDWDWSLGEEFVRFDDPTDDLFDATSDELGFSDNDGDPVAEVSSGSGNKKDVWTNARWSFNVIGVYQVAPEKPWGFNLSGSVSGREGFPSPPYAGGARIQIADFDRFRNDDILVFDARLEKEFSFDDWGLTLSLDGFNLLDEDYVLQRERNVFSSSANRVRERLSPRVFRLGVRLRFH